MMMLKAGKESDESLVRRALSGDRDAFNRLVARYLQTAHAVAYAQTGNHADAEDASQEAFVKAYQALPTLRKPAGFGAWLTTLARNAAIDLARKRSRHVRLADKAQGGRDRVDHPAERNDRHDVVRTHVMALEEQPREVILLYYFAGNSIKEIARILNITPAAVQKRLSRAREALSERLVASLGDSAETARPKEERLKKVLGAVVAAPIEWEAAPAAAVGVGALFSFVTLWPKTVFGIFAIIAALGGLWIAMPPDHKDMVASASDSGQASAGVAAASGEPDQTVSNVAETADQADDSSVQLASTTDTLRANAVQSSSVALDRGDAGISGVVLDRSGAPVADATVVLQSHSWPALVAMPEPAIHVSVKSDENGAFAFAGLPFPTPSRFSSHNDSLYYTVHAFGEAGLAGVLELFDDNLLNERLTLVLTGSEALRGRVVNDAGEGIANAVVIPHGLEHPPAELVSGMPWDPRFRALWAVTDREGNFTIPQIWPGNWSFIVYADGFAPLESSPMASGTDDAVFTLDVGVRLTIRVAGTEADMSELAMTLVFVDEPRREIALQSDGDGLYSATGLQSGEYAVALADSTLVVAAPNRIRIEEGQSDVEQTIELAKGATVSGRVFFEETNEAIPDAIIRTGQHLAKTDNQGRYRLSGLPSGRQILMFQNVPGYSDGGNYQWEKRIELSVEAGETYGGQDFAIRHGASVTGCVIDPDGNPVEGILVQGRERKFNGMRVEDWTNSAGEFELLRLNPPDQMTITARSREFAGGLAELLDVPEGGVRGVEIVVYPAASMAGVIVDGDGKPMQQTKILPRLVKTGEDGSEKLASGTTWDAADAEGRFSVSGLAPGTYDCQLLLPGTNVYINKSFKRITLDAGERAEGVRIVYEPEPGKTIVGRVVDYNGNPVSGAKVGLGGPLFQDVTGPDGAFALDNVEHEFVNVTARHNEFGDGFVLEVPVGTTDAEVVLQGLGSIEGRVVDKATGEAVTNFEVAVGAQRHVESSEFRKPFNDDDGRFLLENVNCPDTAIAVHAKGYATGVVKYVEVSPGETTEGVLVELERGGRVRGVVVDPAGNPLADALVFLDDARGHDWHERVERADAVTDGQGRFTLVNVSPSVERLTAVHQDFDADAIAAIDGMDDDVRIAFERAGRIEGFVFVGGAPQAELSVTLIYDEPEEAGVRTVRTGEDGRFAFENIVSGNGLVRADLVHGPGMMHESHVFREVVIGEGAVTEADLVFANGSGVVTGTLSYNGEAPANMGVRIDVIREDGIRETHSVPVDSAGRYRIEHVPAGQYTYSLLREPEPNTLGSWPVAGASSMSEGAVVTRDFRMEGASEDVSDGFWASVVALWPR